MADGESTQDFAASFLEGILSPKGLVGRELADIERKRATKLQLAVLSQKLEIESQKQQELELFKGQERRKDILFKEAFRRDTTPSIDRPLAKESFLRVQLKEKFPRMTEEQAQAITGRDALGLLRIQGQTGVQRRFDVRFDAPEIVERDIQGVRFVEKRNRRTGEVESREAVGLRKTISDKLRGKLAELDQATNLLQAFSDATGKVISARTFFETIPQAARVTLDNLSRENEDVAVFLKSMDGALPLLVRALGEKGTLATQDVERIQKALPDRFDTAQTAAAKLAFFEAVFERNRGSWIKAATRGESDFLRAFDEGIDILELTPQGAIPARRSAAPKKASREASAFVQGLNLPQ